MSKPIGMNGLARIATDNVLSAVFKATTAATKTIGLDPAKTYGLFASGAGPSDITVQTTSDSQDRIADGTAKYAALKTYAAMAAAGGFLGAINGATGVKVTHVKNGVAVDDAPTVAKLGGRFELRAVAGVPDADAGLGVYTPLTAT